MNHQAHDLAFQQHHFSLARDEDLDAIVTCAHALASPERLRILRRLYETSMTVTEVAEAFYMSVSTAAFHLRILRDAGLIDIKLMPGKRGRIQLCQNLFSSLHINAYPQEADADHRRVIHEIPVGLYTGARMEFVAGFCTADEQIMFDDGNYFSPRRAEAQLLWASGGYVEYTVSNTRPESGMKRITLSLELCSETLCYQNGWKSDITFWLNGIELLTYTSPSDFGGRRGVLNPSWWPDSNTQYGELKEITVSEAGVFLDGFRVTDATAPSMADLDGSDTLVFRIGNKPGAKYAGGFNLFGSAFGDYKQDIRVEIEYE